MNDKEVEDCSSHSLHSKEEDATGLRLRQHEMLLSFKNDCGAVAFYYWWQQEGPKAFKEWLKDKKKREFDY